MSLHDVYMIHGADANTSDKRRTGVALRYMPSTSVFERDLRPADGKTGVPVDFAQRPLWLLKGVDRSGRNDFVVGHGAHEFFLGDYRRAEARLPAAGLPADAAHHEVVKTVHVEAECSRDQQVDETRWLTEVNRRYGMPNAIVGHAWFHTGNTEEILEQQQGVSAGARDPLQARNQRTARRVRGWRSRLDAGPEMARPACAC